MFSWEDVTVLGRTRLADAGELCIFWSGSGIAFRFRGEKLALLLSSQGAMRAPWIAVEIDGEVMSRFPVPEGDSCFPVLEGTASEQEHTVRVIRETQPMSDSPQARLCIRGLEVHGEVHPISRGLQLTFIGDSLTSGEGAIGPVMEQDWIPTWFSAMHTYAFQTADLLGAQCQIISQSGWGLRCGWDNHPDHTLPSIYDAACAIASWDEKWDFAAHPMDAVIVNLGTNDDGAFHQPPYVDPVSGETFQNKLLADGSYDEACLQAIMDAQVSFLRHLRELHPTAYLFWCYGMIGHNLEACLEAGVRRYSEESGDTRVRYLSLPETAQEDYGARAHPGSEAHRKVAAFLAREMEFLSKGDGEA